MRKRVESITYSICLISLAIAVYKKISCFKICETHSTFSMCRSANFSERFYRIDCLKEFCRCLLIIMCMMSFGDVTILMCKVVGVCTLHLSFFQSCFLTLFVIRCLARAFSVQIFEVRHLHSNAVKITLSGRNELIISYLSLRNARLDTKI